MGLDLAEMIMDVEDAFGITIPEEDLTFATVGELTDYIQTQLQEINNSRKARFPRYSKTVGDVASAMSSNLTPVDMGGAVLLATEVSKRIKTIVSKYANVPPEKINDTDHFINDLGLD